MLFEWIEYFLTKSPTHLKKMEQLHEFISLKYTNRRLKKFWLPHLNNTKNEIIKICNDITIRKNRIVIVGSGQLLDVPIKVISETFKEVILIDLFHPKFLFYKNVKTINLDITNSLEQIYKNKRLHYPDILKLELDADVVISCNIFSQLNVKIEEFLEKMGKFNLNEFTEWTRYIQNNHLIQLKEISKKVCLITDNSVLYLDKNDQMIDRDTILQSEFIDKFNMKKINEWEWINSPLGELDSKIYIKNIVGTYYF